MRHLLITGPPGCGKTTFIERLAAELAPWKPAGFITREIRVGGVRQGFRLLGLDGSEGILAHTDFRDGPRVGRYSVDVPGFEAFLARLDLTAAITPLVMIDEIGKMECLSSRFVALVRGVLAEGKLVVATVALRGTGFIAEVKARPDVRLVRLAGPAGDALLGEVAAQVRSALFQH